MNFNITGKLTNSGSGAVVPIGTVLDFAGNYSPQYYLLCNGQEVSRIDYAELFDVIGTTWGAGNGSTTFNVPNLQGRTTISRGTNQGASYTFGDQTHGSKDAVLVNHKHSASSSFSGINQTGYIEAFPPVANGRGAASGVFSNADSGSDYTYTGTGSNTRKITRFNFSMTPSGSVSTSVSLEGESGTDKNMMPYAVVNKIIRAK